MTDVGTVKLSNPVPRNALSPNDVTPLGIDRLVKLTQFTNVPLGIAVMSKGRCTSVSCSLPDRMYSPHVSMPSGNEMDVRLIDPRAQLPMDFNVLGRVTELMHSSVWKTPDPMDSMPSDTTTETGSFRDQMKPG